MIDVLYVEKYRPKKINDCILPVALKKSFDEMVKRPDQITHMVLCGSQGTGKTTVARALANEIGADFFYINASREGGIDTIRNEIIQFASTVSFADNGVRKIICLDEADFLTPNAQAALRGTFEEFSSTTIFILTCNFVNKLIEPLHSRCSIIEFKIPKSEKAKLAKQFLDRVRYILDEESIEYDVKVLAELIMRHLPDWRRVLNELQKGALSGKIDSEILRNVSDESFKTLIDFMKVKKYTEVRKWVAENSDQDNSAIYRKFYDIASEIIEPATIPLMVVTIAKYQYQDGFVADKEINMAACLAELCVDCLWK